MTIPKPPAKMITDKRHVARYRGYLRDFSCDVGGVDLNIFSQPRSESAPFESIRLFHFMRNTLASSDSTPRNATAGKSSYLNGMASQGLKCNRDETPSKPSIKRWLRQFDASILPGMSRARPAHTRRPLVTCPHPELQVIFCG